MRKHTRLALQATLLATCALVSTTALSPPSYIDDHEPWLREGLTLVVKLNTPGLPYKEYSHTTRTWETVHGNSSILLNFTIANSNHTLLLNGHTFFPLEDFDHPPIIPALSVRDDWSYTDMAYWAKSVADGSFPFDEQYNRKDLAAVEDGSSNTKTKWRLVTFDYERSFGGHDDPSAVIYLPQPKLTLNILGAEDVILDVVEQKIIELTMEDMHHTQSNNPNRSYNFRGANLLRRKSKEPYRPNPPPYKHPMPHPANACNWFYWRCADTSDPPYFLYVWRAEFDQYGKIGSLRHSLHQFFDTSPHLFGQSWIRWLFTLAILTTIGSVALRIYRLFRDGHKEKKKDLEGDVAQHLLDDLDVDSEDDDATLGPRPGEYLVEVRESTSTVSSEDVPPSHHTMSKPLPLPPSVTVANAAVPPLPTKDTERIDTPIDRSTAA